MQYDYSKLKNDSVLDVVETHFKTRQMDILSGTEVTIIRVENGPIFVVDGDEIRYYSGVDKLTPKNLNKLVAVANKLQSTLTLECPILN